MSDRLLCHPASAAVEAKLGRPLRVLHIGNIANNAYNNARIQRQYGIEADVLSYDYYHVMSTPEWEDAEFEGEVDPNAPDWWSTSLKGWNRPRWFVQGPADACIQYLKARHLGLDKLSKLLWTYLEARSLGHVRHLQKADGKPKTSLRYDHIMAIAIVEGLGLDKVPAREAFGPEGDVPETDAAIAQPNASIDRLAQARHGSRLRALLRPGVRHAITSYFELKARLVRTGREAGRRMLHLAVRPLLNQYRLEAAQLVGWRDDAALAERDRIFEQRVERLMTNETGLDAGARRELQDYVAKHPRRFFRILRDYDIVQLYSLDGFIAAMNGLPRYCAYEHGTLRELPFENGFYGALTRCAYADATRVFVTNSDVLPSVERMGLDPARVVCLPHAFDDRKLTRFREENAALAPPPGPPVIFSPTRQHWRDKSGSWTKGNDVLFRAAAIIASEGYDFRLHLVEWGKEVADSKGLIAELGIADKVVWLPMMKKIQLWEAYCKAHAVADQFTLPVLSGVGFETMVLGRRLISALDETQFAKFFGEAPPCLGASTVEECATQLRRVIADPEDRQEIGTASRDWMLRCHSAARIVDLQACAYQRLLEAGTPADDTRNHR